MSGEDTGNGPRQHTEVQWWLHWVPGKAWRCWVAPSRRPGAGAGAPEQGSERPERTQSPHHCHSDGAKTPGSFASWLLGGGGSTIPIPPILQIEKLRSRTAWPHTLDHAFSEMGALSFPASRLCCPHSWLPTSAFPHILALALRWPRPSLNVPELGP